MDGIATSQSGSVDGLAKVEVLAKFLTCQVGIGIVAQCVGNAGLRVVGLDDIVVIRKDLKSVNEFSAILELYIVSLHPMEKELLILLTGENIGREGSGCNSREGENLEHYNNSLTLGMSSE